MILVPLSARFVKKFVNSTENSTENWVKNEKKFLFHDAEVISFWSGIGRVSRVVKICQMSSATNLVNYSNCVGKYESCTQNGKVVNKWEKWEWEFQSK